jgi:protein involved in polysaccharide export with SLBB domain
MELLMGMREVTGFEYLYRHHDTEKIEQIYNTIAQVREENKQAEVKLLLILLNTAQINPIYLYDGINVIVNVNKELKYKYVVNVTPDLQIKDSRKVGILNYDCIII